MSNLSEVGRVNTVQDQRWDEVLPGVDQELEKFANRRKADVIKFVYDRSGRVILWHKGNEQYSISMLLDASHKLSIYAAVWQDNEQELIRRAVQLPEVILESPGGDEVKTSVVTLARRLRSSSRALSSSNPRTKIMVTPLRASGFL